MPDRPEIGNHGREYLALFDAYHTFLFNADSEPEPQAHSALLRSAGKASAEMEFYEDESATLSDLREVVNHQSPSGDDEVEGRRESLLALLNDPEHKLGSLVLSEEDIRRRL